MSEAGLTFELGTNIIATLPFLASLPIEIVDFKDLSLGLRSLRVCDPEGNWQASDTVPWHIWERFALLLCDVSREPIGESDMVEMFPPRDFQPNTSQGTMIIDRSSQGLASIEMRTINSRPVYSGEIDRVGMYKHDIGFTEALPTFDEHVLVVDGKWIVLKSPEREPINELRELIRTGRCVGSEKVSYSVVATVNADRKTIRELEPGGLRDDRDQSCSIVMNCASLQDINVTLAVRRMKRRAYGLPAAFGDPKLPWTERLAVAQKYSPPAEYETLEWAAENLS